MDVMERKRKSTAKKVDGLPVDKKIMVTIFKNSENAIIKFKDNTVIQHFCLNYNN